MSNWTNTDSAAACADGWNIFECFGSDNGPWQIQRLDEPSDWPEFHGRPYPFAEDADAWCHVWQKAEEGSALHQRALAFLGEHNPSEFDAIRRWCNDKHITEDTA